MPPNYSTPGNTFETWRQAVEDLNFEVLISTYTNASQDNLRKEIARTSFEGLKAMQKETRRTRFAVEKIVYEDDHAFVRVSRRRGRRNEIEILRMIKEDGRWKLLP